MAVVLRLLPAVFHNKVNWNDFIGLSKMLSFEEILLNFKGAKYM